MEQKILSKHIDLGLIKFLPIAMVIILAMALFQINTIKYEFIKKDNSAMLTVFAVISLAIFIFIRKEVEPAKKDVRKILPVLVFTEIPAILGFTLAFLQNDNFYFYVFSFISLVYYAYVYKKLFSAG